MSNKERKANQREAHKNTDPSSQQPLLEMQIIRDHLIVPDTGMDRLSQREPSNWQPCLSLSLGHPRTASVFSTTSPRPPTQTFNLWRRPQANREQGPPEQVPDWPLSRPASVSLLFTQSLMLYVFLSLNCVAFAAPSVNQYYLSNDISSSIQGLSR